MRFDTGTFGAGAALARLDWNNGVAAVRDDKTSHSAVLPLVIEEVVVSKREVLKGKTRVRIVTDTLEERVRTELSGEDVEIQHVAVNRYVEPGDDVPEARTENGVMIVPVLEEVVVVEKRLLLKEEIHIRRNPTVVVSETPVSLRKQRAIVERLSSEGEPITDKTIP